MEYQAYLWVNIPTNMAEDIKYYSNIEWNSISDNMPL